MEYLKNIFFGIDYPDFNVKFFFIKILIFALAILVLGYLLYLLFTKILFRKETGNKELNIQLAFLWSLVAFSIIYSVYIIGFIYENSNFLLNWSIANLDSINFFEILKGIGLFIIQPQILTLIGLIVIFYVKQKQYLKQINN